MNCNAGQIRQDGGAGLGRSRSAACARCRRWMLGWIAMTVVALSWTSRDAAGQVPYGAAVPPLVTNAEPTLQGPMPAYGAPVSTAPVPSFWQVDPANAPVTYGGPQGEPLLSGDPAAVYGDPGSAQPLVEMLPESVAAPVDGGSDFVESIAAPVEEELIEDIPPFQPVWYNPISWIGPYWDGSVEVGLNGSSGNSDARSIRTGFDLSRETQRTNWDIDFVYNKNASNGEETQHNALFSSNWDVKLRNPRWTWFSKLGLEYDEFKNFDLRLSLNTGLGYLLLDTDKTQFRPRFGAGASREFGGADEEWHPEAVFGFDFSHQISSRQEFKATVDYYPRWDDFSDYRLLTDVSWELVLDEINNLSLKVGVIDRYDSTPNGAKENDVDYSVLLLWSL